MSERRRGCRRETRSRVETIGGAHVVEQDGGRVAKRRERREAVSDRTVVVWVNCWTPNHPNCTRRYLRESRERSAPVVSTVGWWLAFAGDTRWIAGSRGAKCS